MFAHMIYEYKESHQGVKIPLRMYHTIEQGQVEAETIKLPKIFVKQGRFSNLNMAV